jgi:hypothetical protein
LRPGRIVVGETELIQNSVDRLHFFGREPLPALSADCVEYWLAHVVVPFG